MDTAEKNENARVVVLTGVDNTFSSGVDLTDPDTLKMIEQDSDISTGISTMFKLINLKKPTIAAVNGYALGRGVEYALMCDMIIASERAVFGFIGPSRGMVCPYAIIRLADEIGRAKAKELILTCDRISAQEALRIGLINKLVPHAKLMEAVIEMAEKIKKTSPLVTRLTKSIINQGLEGYEESLAAVK